MHGNAHRVSVHGTRLEPVFNDITRPPLREADLRSALVDGPLADYSDVRVVGEVGSTNAELLEFAATGDGDRSALIAEFQSAGRGRSGRAWTAPAGSQVALSVLIRPGAIHPDLFGWLPLVTGLAVRDALAGSAGIESSLKWPNDVMVGEGVDARKIAGILVEMTSVPAEGVYSMSLPAIVVGVGLNVSLREDELPVPHATSIDLERAASGKEPADRLIVAKELLRALAVRHNQWRACERGSGSVISDELYYEYIDACATVDQAVRVELPSGDTEFGTATKIDRSGQLVVDRGPDAEPFTVAAGDVHHVRPDSGH